MRISDTRIKELQALLNENFRLMYTDEEAQQAGLAIMRFTLAKLRKNELTNIQENSDGNDKLRVERLGKINTSNANN